MLPTHLSKILEYEFGVSKSPWHREPEHWKSSQRIWKGGIYFPIVPNVNPFTERGSTLLLGHFIRGHFSFESNMSYKTCLKIYQWKQKETVSVFRYIKPRGNTPGSPQETPFGHLNTPGWPGNLKDWKWDKVWIGGLWTGLMVNSQGWSNTEVVGDEVHSSRTDTERL